MVGLALDRTEHEGCVHGMDHTQYKAGFVGVGCTRLKLEYSLTHGFCLGPFYTRTALLYSRSRIVYDQINDHRLG